MRGTKLVGFNRVGHLPKLKNGVYIYVLYDPYSKQPKYVGQTNDPLLRLKQHMRILGWLFLEGTKREWLFGLYKSGMTAEMRIVAIVEKSIANRIEMDLIRCFESDGFMMFNKVRNVN